VSIFIAILKEIAAILLPELFKELRRPRETLVLGGDADLRDDVAASITSELAGLEGGS
jgi:hypothetical protein